MINKEYILNELRNGKEYNDIMDEISNVLNEVAKEFDAEQEEKNTKQYKIYDMQEIIDLIHNYFIEYYTENDEDKNELNKAFKNNVKAEEIVELFDSCFDLTNSLINLDTMKRTKVKKKPLDSKGEIEINVEIEPDKILSDFLKLLK